MGYLYGFEAVGIQRYILATDKLREMVGASEIVEQLCTDLLPATLKKLFGDASPEVPRGAAGAARVRFEKEEMARAIHAVWPLMVSEFAPGLQVVQAIVEDHGADPYQTLLEKLKARRNLVPPSLPELAPPVETNPRTGQGALNRYDDRGQPSKRDGKPLEPAVWRKLQLTAPAKDRIKKWLPSADPSWIWPDDLQQIARGREDRGYVAILHADGNSLGKTIQKLTAAVPNDPAQRSEIFRAFSEAVSEATLIAADAAVREVVKPSISKDSVVPMRPLVLGGDDLTSILRADLALPFTEVFLGAFERESRKVLAGKMKDVADGVPSELLPQVLTACAGIVFVRPTYPFALAYDLAENLCKKAKASSKEISQDPVPSSLLFHRVTTALSGDFDRVLEHELSGFDIGPSTPLRLGGVPYTVSKVSPLPCLSDLIELTECIRDPILPRGPARRLLSELRLRGGDPKRLFERTWEVLGDSDEGVRFRKTLGSALEQLVGKDRVAVWSKPDADGVPGGWTPWHDALTLASILGRQEGD